ncbi:MAG: hypothetical protein LBB19_02780 [Puniceicoccales bacterium]|nr:hypothetical protein [Puniceicoccales bacterium]
MCVTSISGDPNGLFNPRITPEIACLGGTTPKNAHDLCQSLSSPRQHRAYFSAASALLFGHANRRRDLGPFIGILPQKTAGHSNR